MQLREEGSRKMRVAEPEVGENTAEICAYVSSNQVRFYRHAARGSGPSDQGGPECGVSRHGSDTGPEFPEAPFRKVVEAEFLGRASQAPMCGTNLTRGAFSCDLEILDTDIGMHGMQWRYGYRAWQVRF